MQLPLPTACAVSQPSSLSLNQAVVAQVPTGRNSLLSHKCDARYEQMWTENSERNSLFSVLHGRKIAFSRPWFPSLGAENNIYEVREWPWRKTFQVVCFRVHLHRNTTPDHTWLINDNDIFTLYNTNFTLQISTWPLRTLHDVVAGIPEIHKRHR